LRLTLKKIAELVGGEVVGDGGTVVTGVSGIKEAKEGDITFVASERYASLIDETGASAAVVSLNEEGRKYCIPVVKVKNPDLAFVRIVESFAPKPVEFAKGIHETATVSSSAKVGEDVTIQPNCVVEDGAEVGDGTVLCAGVYVGHYASVGKNCLIYPAVCIRERCVVGDRAIIHSNTVVGSDGFGYSTIRGVHYKIPQVGIVEIESDVEIGANVTVDRARFGRTLIKKGAKIDNMVQIAHNVTIGENCVIAAQTGIAGSTMIGDNVQIGGQAGITGHLVIGNNVKIAGRSGVTKDLADDACVSGFPAQDRTKELKDMASLRKLPDLLGQVKKLEERVRELEREAENDS